MPKEASKEEPGLAASLALGEAAKNPDLARHAAGYLDEQLNLQREHAQREAALHDMQAENLKLRNQALRSQHIQFRAQHQHEWLRMTYQGVLSIVALTVLGLIVYAVYSAATDHSVVVNQFQVPPSFVTAGNNGTVVASQFLDQLQNLKASALASPESRAMQGAWTNDIKLQIPDVHVSLGDVRRTLHGWLGHEVEINGEIVLQGKQIALTVRGTGFPAQTFTGTPEDLQNLLENAAEYVYVHAEP
ncbi:MAG: hypothetical protein WCC11_06150 [Gammaproteobacteria bacterium]